MQTLKLSPTYCCVCVKHITLCNCLCSSGDFASVMIRNIRKFGAKNYFTDLRTTSAIHCFRDSARSLKQAAVIRICKNLSSLPFLSKRYTYTRQEQCVDVTKQIKSKFILLHDFYKFCYTQTKTKWLNICNGKSCAGRQLIV